MHVIIALFILLSKLGSFKVVQFCCYVQMPHWHCDKKNTLFAAGDQIYVFKTQEKFCGIINLSFRLQTSVCYSNRKTYSVTWCDKVVKGKKPKSCYPACPHFVFYLTLYKLQMPCPVSVSQVLYDIPDLLTKKRAVSSFRVMLQERTQEVFYLLVLLVFESKNSYQTS